MNNRWPIVALACVALLASAVLHAQYRYEGSAGAIGDAISVGTPADFATTTSFPVTPSGFAGQIVRVRVSLYIVHAADQELSITLTSPGNSSVPLLQNREDAAGNVNNSIGATGANFGTGCADSARTRFEDDVPDQIPTSVAPYVGTFIAVFPFKLASFDGQTANGTWHLQVTDYRAGNTGVLACWSLLVDSTDLVFRDGFD